jgi:hypothetical protein
MNGDPLWTRFDRDESTKLIPHPAEIQPMSSPSNWVTLRLHGRCFQDFLR